MNNFHEVLVNNENGPEKNGLGSNSRILHTQWLENFMDKSLTETTTWLRVLLGVALLTGIWPQLAAAQDQDDPPARVARLGYIQGSVSFQPAGESDWVQAVSNRPMTIGDGLWADQDSRAEVELGSATIRSAANTGFSFLNLDDPRCRSN